MIPQPPGTLRPIPDPQAEMERLAEARKHGPAKVLHVGDVICVYDGAGEVFTGRIACVERKAVPYPDRHNFGVVCAPLEADQ